MARIQLNGSHDAPISQNSVINFHTIDVLETPRLSARKLNDTDFSLLLSTYQNEKVMQTLGGVISEEATYAKFKWNLERWNQDGFGSWLWFDKKSNEFVGRAGLRRMEVEGEQVVEVGYVLMPQFWNKGYATEMALAVVDVAFNHLKLKDIVSFTLTTNKASQRVMEKIGFEFDRNFTYADELYVLYRLAMKHQ